MHGEVADKPRYSFNFRVGAEKKKKKKKKRERKGEKRGKTEKEGS